MDDRRSPMMAYYIYKFHNIPEKHYIEGNTTRHGDFKHSQCQTGEPYEITMQEQSKSMNAVGARSMDPRGSNLGADRKAYGVYVRLPAWLNNRAFKF